MFSKTKYYESADLMPIGRYMLATCRNLKYFIDGDTSQRINPRRLKKAVKAFNKTIIKDKTTTKTLNDINQLSKEEAQIYLHSALVAVVDYANSIVEAGADQQKVLDKLKPVQFLLIERGLTGNSKRNAARLEKVTRNFLIKSNDIQKRLKKTDAKKDNVYKDYLRNIILIEKMFGVKIDENKDSVNKYVLLIDEIKSNGDRFK